MLAIVLILLKNSVDRIFVVDGQNSSCRLGRSRWKDNLPAGGVVLKGALLTWFDIA